MLFERGQVANARNNPSSYRPWKPNCQMTPNANDIILGGVSLRDFADAVNRYILTSVYVFISNFTVL